MKWILTPAYSRQVRENDNSVCMTYNKSTFRFLLKISEDNSVNFKHFFYV